MRHLYTDLYISGAARTYLIISPSIINSAWWDFSIRRPQMHIFLIHKISVLRPQGLGSEPFDGIASVSHKTPRKFWLQASPIVWYGGELRFWEALNHTYISHYPKFREHRPSSWSAPSRGQNIGHFDPPHLFLQLEGLCSRNFGKWEI